MVVLLYKRVTTAAVTIPRAAYPVTDLRDMRLVPQPMTLRQAVANAVLALEHVECCGDDETHSCLRARLMLLRWLRALKAADEAERLLVANRCIPPLGPF